MIWTHCICMKCFTEKYPEKGPPFRMLKAPEETCCFCGAKTSDGIYIRHDPRGLKFCKCKEGE